MSDRKRAPLTIDMNRNLMPAVIEPAAAKPSAAKVETPKRENAKTQKPQNGNTEKQEYTNTAIRKDADTVKRENSNTRKYDSSNRGEPRDGKSYFAAHLRPEAIKQLKMLCIQEDKTKQELMEEALNDLFAKYRMSRIA